MPDEQRTRAPTQREQPRVGAGVRAAARGLRRPRASAVAVPRRSLGAVSAGRRSRRRPPRPSSPATRRLVAEPSSRRGARAAGPCSSPNGSWYWSSPAPWAKAAAGSARSEREQAAMSRGTRHGGGTRRHPTAGVRGRYARARAAPCTSCVLTDRDWTHPQGGGTGTNLYGQVARWVAWGHRVTVIAGDYPGAEKRRGARARTSTIHRMGTRLTVFPRAALGDAPRRRPRRRRRPRGRQRHRVLLAAVAVAARRRRVALVHHVHQDHYVAELGLAGPDRRVPARARCRCGSSTAARPS